MEEQPPKKSKARIFIMIGVILIVLVAIFLIFSGKSSSDSELSEEIKEFCVGKNPQSCYVDFAADKKDPSLCTDVVDAFIEFCKEEAETQNIDPSDCELIRGDSNFNLEDACRSEVAAASGNTQNCESINNPISKGYCYYGSVETTGDITDCDKISDEADQYHVGLKSLCYGKVGVIKKDLSICDGLDPSENFGLWKCYSELAIGMKDPSICEESGLGTTDIERCYSDVALGLLDSSICDEITSLDNSNYQECVSRVEAKILAKQNG